MKTGTFELSLLFNIFIYLKGVYISRCLPGYPPLGVRHFIQPGLLLVPQLNIVLSQQLLQASHLPNTRKLMEFSLSPQLHIVLSQQLLQASHLPNTRKWTEFSLSPQLHIVLSQQPLQASHLPTRGNERKRKLAFSLALAPPDDPPTNTRKWTETEAGNFSFSHYCSSHFWGFQTVETNWANRNIWKGLFQTSRDKFFMCGWSKECIDLREMLANPNLAGLIGTPQESRIFKWVGFFKSTFTLRLSFASMMPVT